MKLASHLMTSIQLYITSLLGTVSFLLE